MKIYKFLIWNNGDSDADRSRYCHEYKLKTSKNWVQRKAKKLVKRCTLITGCRCYCAVQND